MLWLKYKLISFELFIICIIEFKFFHVLILIYKMGGYEAKVYLDNQILKTIEIKNDTPLSEIRSSCENNSYFDNDSYNDFLSKYGDILKRDSTFIVKDVVQ